MSLLMRFYIYFLRFIYYFMKLRKTRNRIVFLSRQSNDISLDFKLLKKEIEKQNSDVEIKVITKKIEKKVSSVIKGFFVILKSMCYLATSKIVIIDGYNIQISTLKHKDDLKVFQIWHSLGAIKKFGLDALNTKKDQKVAKVMCMHKGYDYINCGSDYMRPYFSKAFGYTDNLNCLGLPRIDYLVTNYKVLKKRIYTDYPSLKSKKIILYAPTFRKDNNYKIDELINSIDLTKYNLIIKVHPSMKTSIKNKKVYTCNSYSTLKLLAVADYVITDYSGIFVESLALNKKIYLYTYDIDNYKKIPGLNIDLEKEFKSITFKDEKKLFESLCKNKYDKELLKDLKSKTIVSLKGDITYRMVKFILEKGGIYEKEN